MKAENLLPYLLKTFNHKQILEFFKCFEVKYHNINSQSALQDPHNNEFRLGVRFGEHYATWFIEGTPEELLEKFYRFRELNAFL